VLYEKRAQIVTGKGIPTSEDISEGIKAAKEDDGDYVPPTDTSTAPIPDFWLTIIKNHLEVGTMVGPQDSAILKHLVDVRLSYLSEEKPSPDFKLEFVFESNDFFTNSVLTKTFKYKDDPDDFDIYTPDSCEGTAITWKSGQDVTAVKSGALAQTDTASQTDA
jgi:nucleosome assembly protein 1-like 1